MSFTWQDFADLAERLVIAHTDEASQRTAISRAYYAAYHAASKVVRSNSQCPPDQPRSYRLVWRLLRVVNGAYGVEVAERGIRLRNLRTGAGYRNPYPGSLPGDVMNALAVYRAIMSLLRKMEQPSPVT